MENDEVLLVQDPEADEDVQMVSNIQDRSSGNIIKLIVFKANGGSQEYTSMHLL